MRLAVLDFETTGVDPLTCRIVEAAVVDEASNTLFHSLLNPGIPVPPEATQIHGYSDAMLAKRPRFAEVAPALLQALDGRVLAGYNVFTYDLPLLNAELARIGRAPYTGPVLDAFLMWSQLETRCLTNCHARFCPDVPMGEAHNALADSVATAQVIAAMASLHSLKDDAPYLASQFLPPSKVKDGVLQIGKHRGKHLRDVDPGYKRWMLAQDFDPQTKAEVAKYL